jgi:hypothetical protein
MISAPCQLAVDYGKRAFFWRIDFRDSQAEREPDGCHELQPQTILTEWMVLDIVSTRRLNGGGECGLGHEVLHVQ